MDNSQQVYPKEINWDYKKRAVQERHETYRWFITCFGIAAVLCSIIWGTTIFNLESVKHPVEFKQQSETNFNRQ